MDSHLIFSIFALLQKIKLANCSFGFEKILNGFGLFKWWTLQDLNLRPIGYEPIALTN